MPAPFLYPIFSAATALIARWLLPLALTVIRWITPYLVGICLMTVFYLLPRLWCALVQTSLSLAEPFIDLLDSALPSIDPSVLTSIWPVLGQSSAFIEWSYIVGLISTYVYFYSLMIGWKAVMFFVRKFAPFMG